MNSNTTMALYTARLPIYGENSWALIFAPLLWLKDYISELWEAIMHMIWKELFKNEAHHYDQVTHGVAFVIFSGFCLFSYYENINDYIVFFLFALWPLETIMVYLAYKKPSYAWVKIGQKEDKWTWHYGYGRKRKTKTFGRNEVAEICIEGDHDHYGAWSVYLYFRDEDEAELLLFHHRSIKECLLKAHELAKNFGVELSIANSCGEAPWAEAEEHLQHHAEYSVWQEQSQGTGKEWKRSFKSLRLADLLTGLLNRAGMFIFLAVIAGIMTRYGYFLTWFLGPRIGLVEPFELYLDLTPSGIIGFFSPDMSWQTILVSALVSLVIAYNVWVMARSQKIGFKQGVLSYEFAGKKEVVSVTKAQQITMIYDPVPSLLVVSGNGTLYLDHFNDESELVELYEKLLKCVP